MTVQVLVAAMYQEDHSLLEKMNIQSDVIVGNQTDYNRIEYFLYRGYSAIYLNLAERGVGLNRNNALIRASGDICLFADDDMVYYDGYVEKVRSIFQRYNDIDIVIFNIKEKVPTRYIIRKIHRVNFFNYLRYGTVRIAVRLKSIREHAIVFNQNFGGGTLYSHGEDNLFLTECLKHKLKILAVPEVLAELIEDRPSTWNSGYDIKYLHDQGCLYRAISKKWWRLLCFQDAVRRHKSYDKSVLETLKLMNKKGKYFD